MEFYEIAVENDDIGERIDVFISESFEDLSRSGVQKLIVQGNILVNSSQTKSNYKLRKSDMLSVSIPEPEKVAIEAEDIPLSIVFEDEDLIVVNKPQSMVVHPAPGHYSGTLVNALMFHCKDKLSGINGELRPGIVHRIDKDTSGLLMVAKTNLAHQSLAKQLAEHTITRKYNAIVFNRFQSDEGTVNEPIGRHATDRKKMTVTQKHSRHAVTHYKVLERLGKFALIEAQLETGRTHQIRVHMAYIGHPLLGDALYGPHKQPFHLQGQALHARVLGFIHPKTGQYLEFEALPPDYFIQLIQKAGRL